ncbi:hypothetical protein CH330_03800 [candidate division WOR-3 bacterium JGI_Cruoil_03_51_56]|uniref:Uncharacterized protein n=2 Tax=candidate division WOR-3 bacterium JGI_Cruoil_03_51_56 TaxID=1973747 RepID=A0A235BV25_UNCW3|nr:MAG: hypothetical protein CH330_03800 [candidate division WOR-3 bacterium JGI_Cruoil_03_51_56]
MLTILTLTALLVQILPFTARFEWVIIENGEADTARGQIYFVAPWRIYYDVDYPLNQQLSVVKNMMTIYYPEESTGYVIKTKSQLETPLSQQSIPAANPDEMMSKLGFKLTENRLQNDTSYAIWKSKNSKAVPFSRVVFGKYKKIPVFTEVVCKDNTPFTRTFFSNHIRVDTFNLPTRIETERLNTDSTTTFETMTYVGIDTSTAFLGSLFRFRVPDQIKLKRINW